MKNSILYFLIALPLFLFSQPQLTIEEDAIGNDRIMATIVNLNNSNLSSNSLYVESGTSTNRTLGEVSTWANSYLPSTLYNGYFGLTAHQKGIILRSVNTGGNLRVLTGGNSIANNTRFFIDSNGEVGLGTDNPRSKFEVLGGNFYVSSNNSGIIMTSPSGSCYLLTVDNGGTLSTTFMTCPN